MSKTVPPKTDELELSLFGPGIGECLVVHLGDGNWMVVDSCLGASSRAVAVEYLESIGVDLSNQVKLIVITHWHDDHIQGISEVVDLADSASVACSAALCASEFCKLLAAGDKIKLVEQTSGVAEFGYVLEILQSRAKSRFAVGPHYWATAGLSLYSSSHPYDVEVISLSPSAQTITDSKAQIGKLIPTLGQSIRRFPVLGPNDLSVVLLVKMGEVQLLLGADLEKGQDDLRGWRAIVRTAAVSPGSNAYKVAHHGSEGADLDEIWSKLVVADPIAMLTPYARGPNPLPSSQDVKRIKSRARELYCSAWPITNNPPRRRGVDRSIGEATRTRWAVRKHPGQIRLRLSMAAPNNIQVDLFDGAKKLK